MAMKGLAIWVSPPYQQDLLFDLHSPLNRDNCLAPFRLLKQKMAQQGYACHTQDGFEAAEPPSDILFLDIPDNIEALSRKLTCSRRHLLIQECEVVVPGNWQRQRHAYFDSVFTWSPELYQQEGKYERAHFSQDLSFRPGTIPFDQKKLATLICANKRAAHPRELYSARRRWIDWFEKHQPELFDLYGVGWDRCSVANRYVNKLLQFSGVGRLLAPRLATYVGVVEQKNSTLQRYRFGFCYENAYGIAGYVTEKMFDVMMAGAVPVYLGAPDINEYVPAECFIDAADFPEPQSLVDHLLGVSATEHQAMVARIELYLASDQAKVFSSECFSDTLCQRICLHA